MTLTGGDQQHIQNFRDFHDFLNVSWKEMADAVMTEGGKSDTVHFADADVETFDELPESEQRAAVEHYDLGEIITPVLEARDREYTHRTVGHVHQITEVSG